MNRTLISLALSTSIFAFATSPSQAAETLPSIFTLAGDRAFTPQDIATQRNLAAASKELARLASSFEKCHTKGVRNVMKDKPHNLEECLGRAQGRFEAKLTKIETKSPGLPACSDFRQMASEAGLNQQRQNALQYCASPGGAMIDGPILY